MDICFVPSLNHLTCVKIVTSLLNNPDVNLCWNSSEANHDRNTLKVKEKISKLLTCNRLKAKLETFIAPILCEVENSIGYFKQQSATAKRIHLALNHAVRQCWLSDGSIDREKLAEILIKRSVLSPIDRFIFACIFGKFHYALDLWNDLYEIEKIYFRHKYSASPNNPDFIVKQYVEWLDTSANQDWESFVASTFQTSLWKSNVYIMKRILLASNPIVRSNYLLKALRGGDVSNDVKHFGLKIMSREEREVIFKKSPINLFKNVLSWPLRNVFLDLTDNLWPYITTNTFCGVLDVILRMIKNEERDYINLLVILKDFWARSPSYCKKAAEKDSSISRPLNFILKYDSTKQFCRVDFLCSFLSEHNESAVDPFPPLPFWTYDNAGRRAGRVF